MKEKKRGASCAFFYQLIQVEKLLESPKGSDEQIDAELRQRGLSLRVVVREIPSVFGDFF